MASNVKLVRNIFPQLVEFRRDLHSNPELAWNEFETTARIIRFLESHGYKNIRRPLETGCVADLIVGPDLPTIAFRADIDALPIPDEKQTDYRSQNEGVSHSCGHDIHTAVLCGIAALLPALRNEMTVNFRAIFQPAEEPIPSGAPKMIETGILDGIQTAWAMHVDPRLPLGSVSLTEGWVNARSIRLEWRLLGSGGHSARPHQADDPLWAGTQLIGQCYQMVSRRWSNPESPVVLTFTGFQSGDVYNAIPEQARLTATLRLTDEQQQERILNDIRNLNRQIEMNSGVQVVFDAHPGAPPVLNDPEIIEGMRENVPDPASDGLTIIRNYRTMGGDDFGWYARKVPSALVRFGTATSIASPQLHTGHFDAPEEVIAIAVSFFLRQIIGWQ